jgi:hypothetical protein
MNEDKVQTIKERMQHILEARDKELPDSLRLPKKDSTLSKPTPPQRDTVIPWMLEEWRRISLPGWRSILKESLESKDMEREEYARWMLKDVLADPEYKEVV